MRKLFSLTMVLMVVAGLVLSACQAPVAAPTTPAPVQPAATDVPAQPVEKAFRVGLVTDVGKVDDKSFNQSAWEGVQMAEKDLGAEIKYIETTDPKDYEKNISTFADEGYDVIVTVGFALGEATQAAAKKYPNVKFIGVDQFQAETVPGVAGLNFPEDQAGFMAGALAALMSKSGQIGAVLGTDAVPPVWRFGEGYKAGALYANPDIKLNVVYHNDVGFDKTFVDPEWGKTTALSMIDKGADVIFGAGGKTGNGALLGGVEKGIPVIGVDTDQYLTVPEAQSVLLTSAMKLIVPGVFNIIKDYASGKWTDGNVYGQAALAPYHDWDSKVPADVKAKVDEITTKLQAGELKTDVPPAKPADQPTEVKKLKVGLVTDVGKVDDKSFNQSAWEGVQMAEKDLGAEIKYIETTDPKDYEKNISTFADEGYDVIVTVGFALGEATQAAAKKYPNVKFIGVDQFQAETVPGVAGLNFPEDQAGFMAGALAALMSKSGQIGAVLGTDAVPPVWRFGEGYKAGALYANPDIKLNVVYHNDVGFDKTFVDPEWGKTTALSMIDKGADVIFGAGGKTGNGALLGGVEKGIPVIGVDTDQYLTVPEAQSVLLTSAMKLIVPGVFNIIKDYASGKWTDGNVYGQAALAPYHDWDSKVPADVKAKVDEITTKLQAGELKTDVPPAKPAE